jgi:two-component system sensor histidine kinase PhoQ
VKARALSFRLLVAAGLILAIAFGLMAFILEQGFRSSAERALKEKLQVQIYALLSVAELTQKGQLKIAGNLHEPRFATPGSGLYAFVQKKDGLLIWRSASALGEKNELIAGLRAGESVFLASSDQSERFALQYDVIWESDTGKEYEFVFTASEEAAFLKGQVDSFSQILRKWLLLVGLALLLVQFIILRWSLKPLRTIGKDLGAIEQGQQQQLHGRYPQELQALANNINGLLSSERAHIQRYRNTLADLAHSLKTPLAILRGCLEDKNNNEQLRITLQNQISRMDEIVEYQLQKAAVKGQKQVTGRTDLVPVVEKIIASLNKVYVEKHLTISLDVPESCFVQCEEGDLYELCGNLLDNACKWCKSQVKFTVLADEKDSFARFSVEDDGPGIPNDKINDILKRGVRADQNIHGHGIGLAVVNELISLLGGKLTGEQSKTLGGLKWLVCLK